MNHAILRPAVVLGSVGVLSKALQVLTGLLLAYRFGATTQTDMYLLAKSAPIGVYLIVDNLIYNAFLPFYQHDRRASTNLLTVAGWLLLAGMFASTVLFLAAPGIVDVLGRGTALESRADATELLRWMAASALFFFPASALKAANAARQRYLLAGLDGLVISATLAGALLVATPGTDYHVLAAALPVSGALLMLLQALGARRELRIVPSTLRIPQGRQLLAASVPLLGINTLQQFHALFMVAAAGYLGSGALSCMNFSYSVIQIPVGVVDLILVSAWFPLAAAMVHDGDPAQVLRTLERTGTLLFRVAVPLAVWFVLMRSELIHTVLLYGRFDGVAADRTAQALIGHALALPGWLLEALACRCLFAQQRHGAYLKVITLRCVALPPLCLLIAPSLDLLGISLAFAASATLGATYAFWQIYRGTAIRDRLAQTVATAGRVAFPALMLLVAHQAWMQAAPSPLRLSAMALLPLHAFASLTLVILCYRLVERLAPAKRP